MALKRIVEGDIAAEARTGARAAPCTDSVGVGWYHIDLHDCVGNPTSMYAPTLPFQIPLGALIPRRITNLIAACKNIGTTHLTNGAYRLHPIEWNIGEAAGALAAWCCTANYAPHDVYADVVLLRQFQRHLLERGVPLAWTVDLSADDPLFVTAQLLVLGGAIAESSPRFHSLVIDVDEPLSDGEKEALMCAMQQIMPAFVAGDLNNVPLHELPTWREVCAACAPLIDQRILLRAR